MVARDRGLANRERVFNTRKIAIYILFDQQVVKGGERTDVDELYVQEKKINYLYTGR